MKNVFDYRERSGFFGTESDVPPRDLEEREALDSEWAELGWQSERGESAWESEAKGNSRAFIRWVQSSLNKVLGTRLTVDGVMGSATRSTIRSFQKSRGLTADGKVGPATAAALKAALGASPGPSPVPAPTPLPAGGSACTRPRLRGECLDDFDFDKDQLKPGHRQQIRRIAQCIVDSHRSCRPIRRVQLIGHTDPVGPVSYNLELARRRAEQVRRELVRVLDELQPGLSARPDFRLLVESRGEAEPTDLDTADAARNRRVEVFMANTPTAASRCQPYKARLRMHLKIFHDPCISIPVMIENMKCLYGLAGFLVEVASIERLQNLPNLDGNDPIDVGDCREGTVTAEQQQLFNNRNNVKDNELVAYFVRATSPDTLNGCAAHPPGRPGVIIASIASEWTLAHEVGHVLGLSHPDDEAGRPLLERLMTSGGTANIQGIPRLLPCETTSMDASAFTIDC